MNKKFVGIAGVALASILLLSSYEKVTEQFQDANVNSRNTAPADIVTMPDGFSNVATKCDHGNRLYVAFHGDGSYAAVAVVPADPTCKS